MPPSRASGRGPLLALLLVVFVSMTGFGLVIPIVPFFGVHLGATATQITLAIGAYSFGQFLAAPLWGRLSDRFGRRPILIATLALTAVFYVVLAHADTIDEIGITRFMTGLVAGNIAAAFAAAADLSTEQTRARTMGALGAGVGLGFIVGPAIGGLVAGAAPDQADFARVGYVAAALAAAAAVAAVFLLPETRPQDAQRQTGRRIAFWSRPRLFALVGVTLLTLTAQALMESSFGLWSHVELQWGPPQLGATFCALGLVSALLQGGGMGRLTKLFGEAHLLTAGLVLYAAGFGALYFAHSAGPAIAAMVLLALGGGVVSPAMQALVSLEAAPEERGGVLGVQQSASSLGRVFGPLASGPVFDMLGHNAPFALGALLMALAAAIAGAVTLRR